jgi:dolichol kinase
MPCVFTMFVLPIIFTILFFIEMIVFGILLVHVALRNKREKHTYGFNSSLVSAVQVFFIAACFTFISPFPGYPGMFPYPYSGYMQWWVLAWVIITTAFYLKVRHQKQKDLAAKNDAGTGTNDGAGCNGGDGLKYQHEKARKAFHLAGLLAVASYYLVAPLLAIMVNDVIVLAGPVYEILWGPLSEAYVFSTTNLEEPAIVLTLFALSATTVLVMLVDWFRLLAGDEYSIITLVEKRAGKILRDKEKRCPGAQDYIAISGTCAWLIGMLFQQVLPGSDAIHIALGAILMSTMADGAAAIIGKAFGRHKVARQHGQVKSIEGFIAGFVVAFLCGIFLSSWIVALVMAAVFLLIDYWSPPIADNALNGVVLVIVGCVVALIV